VDSPFPHHGPLEPSQVRGRDGIVGDLVAQLTAHRPTVLVAPRRFGKTSVLGRVASDLHDTVTIVRLDLYELRSWADLAVRLDQALVAVPSGRRSALDRIAAGLEVNLGVVKATLDRPDRPAPDITADRLLDVLVALAGRQPVSLICDEFSSIVRLDGAAGLFRTKLQHHFQRIGLLFAGSEPSTMRMLFTEPDQPFFGQADLIELPALDLEALTDIIDTGFEGRPPAALASRIHAFSAGHPHRAMQLADAAWHALRDGVAEDEVWEQALERARTTTAYSHETRFSALGPADQAAMRLAASSGALFGAHAELLSLAPSSAQAARRRLLESGQIVVTDEGVSVVDPLYADWIRRRFAI
jgi:uncharacterized protein